MSGLAVTSTKLRQMTFRAEILCKTIYFAIVLYKDMIGGRVPGDANKLIAWIIHQNNMFSRRIGADVNQTMFSVIRWTDIFCHGLDLSKDAFPCKVQTHASIPPVGVQNSPV